MQHSAKNFLCFSKFFAECHSAEALGKACFYFLKNFFAECHCQGTRQSIFYLFFNFLCRVQWPLHSANLGNCCCYFPSFAECNGHCTRQSHNNFFCFLLFHVNNSAYIYIRNHNSTQYIRNHIYIYHKRPIMSKIYNILQTTSSKFTSSIHKGMPT